MPGVGEQRDGIGGRPIDHLDDDEDQVEGDAQRKGGAIAPAHRPMRMTMAVMMAVTMVMVMAAIMMRVSVVYRHLLVLGSAL